MPRAMPKPGRRPTSSSPATTSCPRSSTVSPGGMPDGVGVEVLRRALGAEAALLRRGGVRGELLQHAAGDEDLARLRRLGEAGGDVDVDAEVAAAELAGAAEVDAGA